MMELAATVAVGLLSSIAGFQIALAAGAPWGPAAWGGQHPGVLPTRLRVASGIVGIVVYPLLIAVVAAAGGLTTNWLGDAATVVMWLMTGFFVLGTVMNAVSRSRPERLWAVVSLGIAVCCAIVAYQL